MNPRTHWTLVFAVISALAGMVSGEVVEEETWYGASGEVVKTVKRTYSGADVPGARSSWEPSWVAREREQAKRLSASGPRRYRSRYGSSRYAYYSPIYYRAPYYYRGGWNCGRYRYGRTTTGWRFSAGNGGLLIGYSR